VSARFPGAVRTEKAEPAISHAGNQETGVNRVAVIGGGLALAGRYGRYAQ